MINAFGVTKILGTKDDCFSTLGEVTKKEFFPHLEEDGAEILSMYLFQTHRSRLSCQNFDKVDYSKVIPVKAGNFDIIDVYMKTGMKITFDPNHTSEIWQRNRILWL